MAGNDTALIRQVGRAVQRLAPILRGERVMFDTDLASLYGVETRALVQAVKRNRERFPGDFMLQLTAEEAAILRSQTVISSASHGGRVHGEDVYYFFVSSKRSTVEDDASS